MDEPLTETSHSRFILDIIKQHTSIPITLIETPQKPLLNELYQIVEDLSSKVTPSDVVLCAWLVPGDCRVDQVFEDLCDRCWVVAAAGNFNKPIEDYSPARAEKVITVGCLNKSLVKATLSNYSETKKIVWVPGTNYNVGWKNASGTSVSAALYTAFLAEAIDKQDYSVVHALLEQQKQQVSDEIKANDK